MFHNRFLSAAAVFLAALTATPAQAAGLVADRGFWLVGFSLLFILTAAVQVAFYLSSRERQRVPQKVRARSRGERR